MATIERALWEAAACGGSAHRANVVMNEAKWDLQPESEGVGVPPARTIRDWMKGSFRNRYQEILEQGVRQLEEVQAQQATDFAIRSGEAMKEALRQTSAGLSSANGVEASQILRNVAQARKMAVDEAGELRRRPYRRAADESLAQIAKELEGLGVVKVISGIAEEQARQREERGLDPTVVDATVVADDDEASDAA